MTTTNATRSGTALDPAFAELVQEVTSRVPLPVDVLEITALLESLGVTDELARLRYAAADAFALAAQVLAAAHSSGRSALSGPSHAARESRPSRITWTQAIRFARRVRLPRAVPEGLIDYAQGPLAFIPALVLLLVIRVYGTLGDWKGGQVLALGLGMTGSMLMCSGFVHALGRRTSICLAMDQWAAAARFLRQSMILAGMCATAVVLALVGVATVLDLFTPQERLTFGLAFLGLSAIWIVASGLSLLRASAWLPAALSVGLVADVAVDRAVAPFSELHLYAGTCVGFGLSLGGVWWAMNRATASQSSARQARRVILPSRVYLIAEATPYFIYGALYALLPFIPHPLGWLGALGAGEERSWAVINLEAGLTLSLPPLILASGVTERTLRKFWAEALAAQVHTLGDARSQFGQRLVQFYKWHRRRYLIVLGLLSGVTFALFRIAQASGLLVSWLGYDRLDVVENLFAMSLLSYWLLGWGLFNCMFPVSLARPRLATQAVAPAIAATVLVGVPLSLGLHFSYTAAAMIVGAATFVAASSRITRRVLESADYYYYSAY